MSKPCGSPGLHFSIDDVLECLLELDGSQESLYEHWFFAFLRQLHFDFDISIDLYLFYRRQVGRGDKDLSCVSDRFIADFASSPWLRFGYHALDYITPPYQQTVAEQLASFSLIEKEIIRFTGRGASSPLLRLHYFSETYEIYDFLAGHGVHGLLLTDKQAVAYHLPDTHRMRLERYGHTHYRGLDLYRTHARVENLHRDGRSNEDIRRYFELCMRRHEYITLFTHETELRDLAMRDKLRQCLEIMKSL